MFKQEKDIDKKIIKLNNSSVYSIFDSRSSIGKNISKRLLKNKSIWEKHLRVAQQFDSEIMYSDWLNLIMWLSVNTQS